MGARWATVTVTDGDGRRHSVDVQACSSFDAAHLFVMHAKATPQSGLPPLGADTVFEVIPAGAIHYIKGAALQRWIQGTPGAEGAGWFGYVNSHTGDHKAGTHAFRRFRNTYLKNETSCPKGLRDYWLGHAGNSMDDLYDMVEDDASFRKQKAAEYGVGFQLPCALSVVPNVPKKRAQKTLAKAA